MVMLICGAAGEMKCEGGEGMGKPDKYGGVNTAGMELPGGTDGYFTTQRMREFFGIEETRNKRLKLLISLL